MDMEFLLAANTPPGNPEFPKSLRKRTIFAYRAEKPAWIDRKTFRTSDIAHMFAKWSEMNHLD
jgi:hypothetical protein